MALHKPSKTIVELKEQGIDYLAGANAAGVTVQAAQATQAGSSPFAVTFASLGLKDMADVSYSVMIGGDKQAVAGVTQASKSVTGFSITGGANADVHDVIVVGRIKGQVDKNGKK